MKRILAALLVGAALTGVAQAQVQTPGAVAKAEVVPLEAFAQFPTVQSPRLSPGAKVIAAKVRLQGRQALAILPVGTVSKPEIIAKDGDFDDQGEWVIRNWRWADDENLIISLTSRQNFYGQWFDASRLVAYNIGTKKMTPLAWQGAKFSAGSILWMSREGKPTLLLERTPETEDTERLGLPEVIKVDVLTGKTDIVQRPLPSITSWYADGNGVVRLGTGYDRSSGKLKAMYRRAAGSNLDTIYEGKIDMYSGAPLPEIFLPEADKAIATSRKDGYSAVYELDLKTMQLGKKLFAIPGYDVDGVSGGPKGDRLEAVYATEKRQTVHYLDPHMKELQKVLDETFGKGNAYIASADRAREMVVVYVAPTGSPGGYYVYDTRTGGISLLGWTNSMIKDARLNPVQSIRYKASDGKEIEAVLTLPRHRAGQKNLPLIVLPHGGPWARDSEEWDMWAQPLAELGYAVVQPNFRGSSGYGRDWEKAGEGAWGERMQDDLLDAITHLAGQGIADPKRVCIMGWSYGGYAASRAAQRDGGKYRCAISGAGVHDLPDMVAYDKDYLGEYMAKKALGSAGELDRVSPARHAKEYAMPILIVHGEKDQRVPVAQSRDLVKRLKAAGKVEGRDFEYVEIPRETHNLLLESSRLTFIQEVKKFLDKHNPA